MTKCSRCGDEFESDELTTMGSWRLCEICVDDL